MNQYKCPKYQTCSAPICPLDSDWSKRTCQPDERVCTYQVKLASGKAIDLPQDLLELIMRETPKIRDAFPRVTRQMDRAYQNSLNQG